MTYYYYDYCFIFGYFTLDFNVKILLDYYRENNTGHSGNSRPYVLGADLHGSES